MSWAKGAAMSKLMTATLLCATRALMDRTRMRSNIVSAELVGTSLEPKALRLRISAGGGRPRQMALPCYYPKVTKVAITSLMVSNGAKNLSWYINGEPHVGGRSVLHFGASGACFVQFSSAAVRDALTTLYRGGIKEALKDPRRAAEVQNAPTRARLYILNEKDEYDVVDLPEDAVAVAILDALSGFPQSITPEAFVPLDIERRRGYHLSISSGAGQMVLHRPQDRPALFAA